MNHIRSVLCILALVPMCLKSDGDFNTHALKVEDKLRTNRKYDFPYPGKFGEDNDESENSDLSSVSRVAIPREDDKSPHYSNIKDFDYGLSYPPFNKGYPFKSYSKGKGETGDMPPMNPIKMMEMMMMMKTMQDLQESPKDEGLLSKFVDESKSFLMAAIVPLSIILAAIVPIFMNYIMTGSNLPLIQTTASNKLGRSIVDANILEDILQKFEAVSRHIETDECPEKTLCKVVLRDSSLLNDHIKNLASKVANLVKDEWIKNLKVKKFVHGLGEGNCESICSSIASTPRN